MWNKSIKPLIDIWKYVRLKHNMYAYDLRHECVYKYRNFSLKNANSI